MLRLQAAAGDHVHVGAPRMAEWRDATGRARPLLGLRGQGLVKASGSAQIMVILFRLLFVAYAEDKDLLPYRIVAARRVRRLRACPVLG